MIEQKGAVIPSEVDPFVHERINAVEGPAVSAPSAAGVHVASSQQEKQVPPRADGLSSPIPRLGRNDSNLEIE
jgi:hypothetical protein